MKLVPIEMARNQANPHGGAIWINPEHVVSLRPLTSGAEPDVMLSVEIKLEGMPLFSAPLGNYHSNMESKAAWGRFLLMFSSSDGDGGSEEAARPLRPVEPVR